MGESIFLTALFTVAAILEAVFALYILIANSKSYKNRAVAALLILFSINNVSVIGMFTTFTLDSARIFHWLLVATTYSIGPGIFLTSLLLLRPKLGKNRWVYASMLLLALFPFITATLDFFGISQLIVGSNLFFKSLIPGQYLGGFVEAGLLTGGLLRSFFLGMLIGFLIISLIYPSLFVAIRDRKKEPANSKMAWTLFAAVFFSTIVAGARNVIGPQETILLQNL
ncbi:MAG: hypothetical protein N2C13_00525, partial [Chloroflexota bacterium]